MRLLVINPNVPTQIIERLALPARGALDPQDTLTAVTAQDGPRVVHSAPGRELANANALALVNRHATEHDVI